MGEGGRSDGGVRSDGEGREVMEWRDGEGREWWGVMEGGKGEWWRVMEGRGRSGRAGD